jgi:DNA-binding NarL/FixJ family response regulator
MGVDILIVEDHAFVAESTKALLEVSGGTAGEIITAGTAQEVRALLHADRRRWRLILLDLEIPGATGLSLAREIKELGLAPITCVLTGADHAGYVTQVRNDGFLGYVLKAAKTRELHAAMTAVLAGRPAFPAADAGQGAERVPALTRRQAEILQLVGDGLTSKAIGQMLRLSPGTVDNHVAAAIAALGSKTRSEALRRALLLGLIKAGRQA